VFLGIVYLIELPLDGRSLGLCLSSSPVFRQLSLEIPLGIEDLDLAVVEGILVLLGAFGEDDLGAFTVVLGVLQDVREAHDGATEHAGDGLHRVVWLGGGCLGRILHRGRSRGRHDMI